MRDGRNGELLHVHSERVGTATVVYVEGEVDLSTQGILARELASPCGDIIVDLAGCTYLSARGFDLLDRVAAQCQERSRTLTLVRIPPHLRRIFALLTTSAPIPTAQSIEEALPILAPNNTEPTLEASRGVS